MDCPKKGGAVAFVVDPNPLPQPLVMDCPTRSAVAGLPDDALAGILACLPAKFLCRSKCVSKPWRDLIADRLRCKKLSQTLEGFLYGILDTLGSDGGSVDGQHYTSDDINDRSGEESNESGRSDENLTPDVHGHFIDLLGRPAPLVDPSFSFLRKMPGFGTINLLDSCGGLVLLGHERDSDMFQTPGYIVCNPATEHWVLVPSSGFIWFVMEELLYDSDDDDEGPCVCSNLIFDPAISPHFQLIEFCHTPKRAVVNTYSSETASWTDRSSQLKQWKSGGKWDMLRTITSSRESTVFNKMLHLIVSPRKGPELIAAIDGEGRTRKIISWQENRGFPVFVGVSKGLLHCMSVSGHPDGNPCTMTELSLWVLQDYGGEVWNMKHTVSFSELFGKATCLLGSGYNVVSIHPEHNLVFFVQHWDYKLISYDMDRKQVCHPCTVGCDYGRVSPYFPYFSESPALSKMHLKH